MTTTRREARQDAESRRNNERHAVRDLALDILRQAACGTVMTMLEAVTEARRRLGVRG